MYFKSNFQWKIQFFSPMNCDISPPFKFCSHLICSLLLRTVVEKVITKKRVHHLNLVAIKIPVKARCWQSGLTLFCNLPCLDKDVMNSRFIKQLVLNPYDKPAFNEQVKYICILLLRLRVTQKALHSFFFFFLFFLLVSVFGRTGKLCLCILLLFLL